MTLAPRYFQRRILKWYNAHGRKALPWQHPVDPYRVWISEIMLQQTQVTTVIPYFLRFMQRFPTVHALAEAPQDDVLQHWAGLGYYARARNLHKAAQTLVEHYAGQFPQTVAELAQLTGVGRSTAGAIRSLGFNQPAAILDGNVKRVLARFAVIPGWPGQTAVAQQLWDIAEHYSPQQQCREYTQAMMDIGAMICTRSKPLCDQCPLQSHCQAFQQQRIDEFPGRKPKKQLPVKHTFWLLIQNPHGQVLLHKRPPSGIWGGLWSLPELDNTENVQQFCEKSLGVNVHALDYAQEFRHTFSHYHLDISPIVLHAESRQRRVSEQNDFKWVTLADLDAYGLPAPAKNLLNQWQAEVSL